MKYFRFTGTIPESAEGSSLVCDVLWADVTLSIGGDLLFSSDSAPESAMVGQGQLSIPIPVDSTGKEVVLTYRPTGEGNIIFPPSLRINSAEATMISDIAYANYYGIPAGAFGLVFVMVCGLFLLSVTLKKTDPTLIALALASGGLMLYYISLGFGYYFIDPGLLEVFTSRWFSFLIPAALIVYILLNIKRGALKRFGVLTGWCAAVLCAAYLISLAADTYLARYINESVHSLFDTGNYVWLLHWITIYLVFACSGLAVFEMVRTFVSMRAESESLWLKSNMALNSYRAAEKSIAETAELRHEFRKHITALDLMYKSGKYDELGKTLGQLNKDMADMTRTQFTGNFVINSLLQSAASKAAKNGIRFEAEAIVPDKLDISDDDLCVFLINLLDNASEACVRMTGGKERFIRLQI